MKSEVEIQFGKFLLRSMFSFPPTTIKTITGVPRSGALMDDIDNVVFRIHKVADRYQITHPIRFSRPVDVSVFIEIHLTPFDGYTTLVGDRIKAGVTDYINSVHIGDSVYLTKLFTPANLPDDDEGKTYDITDIKIGRTAGSVVMGNLKTQYNEAVICQPDNIKLVVT